MDLRRDHFIERHLEPDERAERFCDVLYKTEEPGRTYNGLLALTDRRLVFESDTREFLETRSYTDIRELSLQKTYFGSQVRIGFENPDAVVCIKAIDRRDRSKSLLEDIRAKLR